MEKAREKKRKSRISSFVSVPILTLFALGRSRRWMQRNAGREGVPRGGRSEQGRDKAREALERGHLCNHRCRSFAGGTNASPVASVCCCFSLSSRLKSTNSVRRERANCDAYTHAEEGHRASQGLKRAQQGHTREEEEQRKLRCFESEVALFFSSEEQKQSLSRHSSTHFLFSLDSFRKKNKSTLFREPFFTAFTRVSSLVLAGSSGLDSSLSRELKKKTARKQQGIPALYFSLSPLGFRFRFFMASLRVSSAPSHGPLGLVSSPLHGLRALQARRATLATFVLAVKQKKEQAAPTAAAQASTTTAPSTSAPPSPTATTFLSSNVLPFPWKRKQGTS